ncbi:hypothetical protein C1645_153196 [Glomus cerebriforme]|uniref:Uncharacterized protein n=1 Tax=Glomus cerebriforme TaxID=658196 RepID=A0A397TLK5_9GLOM|nr:hypothetical protein C1645_153196 [Glomus cerebriforme]
MQTHGATEANNPELAQTLREFQKQRAQQMQQRNVATVPSVGLGGINGSKRADSGKTPSSTVPKSTMNAQNSQTPPTPLSADELRSLKYQILAFKLISRSLPVPPLLHQAMFNPNQIQGLSTQDIVGSIPSMTGNIIEASNNHHTQKAPSTASTSSADIGSTSNATVSNIPFNSYTNPHTYIKPVHSYSHESRQQRMLIPSIMLVGLDPVEIAAEIERDIWYKSQLKLRDLEREINILDQRIHELEHLNNTNNNEYESLKKEKKRTKIEYMSLKALSVQRKLRKERINVGKSTTLSTSTDRTAFKRMKRQSARDARMTDRLEKQQREERRRKQIQKDLHSIINHCNEMQKWHRTHQAKLTKFGRMVLNFHSQIKKEI